MIPSWAVKGAKVVCVNGKPDTPRSYLTDYKSALPVEGETYTIGGTVDPAYWYRGPRVTIIELPHVNGGYDYGWNLARFRPVTTTKTQAEDVAMIRYLIKQTEVA